jgi:dTDP-4-dehydrorhamnose reductase
VGGHPIWSLSRRAARTKCYLIMFDGPILVTGSTGQVGGAVKRIADARGISAWTPDRTQLDLTSEGDITKAIANGSWAAVVNCAAYTAVDRAETEAELARTVNAIAPAVLARETARAGIPLIHVSTDYVFDGTKLAAYEEVDPVNPLSVYGLTKEAGEAAIRHVNPVHAIIRTAWVLSASGANFLNTMLRLGATSPHVRVVNDQLGCPSSADDIAMALLTVAANLDGRRGTWHFANAGEASWHGLAQHIFGETRRRNLPSPEVIPITTAEYPTPAKRPANSRLATSAIERDFPIRPRYWQEAIDCILAERLS